MAHLQKKAEPAPERGASLFILQLLRGILIAAGVSILGVLLFALCLKMGWLAESQIPMVNQIIKVLSIVLGVWFGLGRGSDQGLAKGGLIGLVYMGLGLGMFCLSAGTSAAPLTWVIDLGSGLVAGGIAGALTVNLRRARKKR